MSSAQAGHCASIVSLRFETSSVARLLSSCGENQPDDGAVLTTSADDDDTLSHLVNCVARTASRTKGGWKGGICPWDKANVCNGGGRIGRSEGSGLVLLKSLRWEREYLGRRKTHAAPAQDYRPQQQILSTPTQINGTGFPRDRGLPGDSLLWALCFCASREGGVCQPVSMKF